MNQPPLDIPQVVAWPDPPRRWSVSSLRVAEACPLQWAFSRATYADGSRGFPERPSAAALRGQVVHRAVDEILAVLATEGCRSVLTPEAGRVLLGLGGLTAIVERHLTAVLADIPTHPRASRVAPSISRQLRQGARSMCDEVGVFVRRTRLQPRTSVGRDAEPRSDSTDPRERAPLGAGTHTEVWLECETPPFVGRIDLITLSPDTVEIADVKTGQPSRAHADQLVAYGVLWANDHERNPTGRPPTSLDVLYPHHTTGVPLPDWKVATEALSARTSAASAALALDPIPATPSAAACQWCPARPACGAYWSSPMVQGGPSGDSSFVDIAVEVHTETGPDLWSVTVEHCPSDPGHVGTATLIARESADLSPGHRLRILGARLQDETLEGGNRVFVISASTEVFQVESNVVSSG